MGQRFWFIFIIFIFALLPRAPASAQPPSKLKVVASLFPLQDFARKVGGDRVQVVLLLPPGAEAHTWEPKPSDVFKISQADIFVYIGSSLEPWIDKILRAVQNKNLGVLEVSRGLPLIRAQEAEEGTGPSRGSRHPERMDPHIWLDFSLDQKIVEAIAAAFSEKDSVNAPFYKNNAQMYQGQLQDLDREYRQTLAECRHRQILLGGHSAFVYLAKRYGLRQIALSGISPEADPTPRKMAEVIEMAYKTGIKFIYVEEWINPKLARALSKEARVGVLSLNPGHNLTAQQVKEKVTFLELMERNLENLGKGLECQ